MSFRRNSSSLPLVLLGLIIALGAILRFQQVGLIEHNVDHAYPIWQALMTLDQGRWPLLGQGTSVLFANPPLTGYLYLPLVALFRSPLPVYLAVIALNTLAIPLAYTALRPLIGITAALVAAFLVAVNPWVIEYSRTTWVQSLLPFFACLLAWLLFPILRGASARPGRRLLLTGLAAAIAVNTYLLAYLFLAPIGVLFVLFWRQVPKRALLGAALIVAAPAAIYALALLSDPAGLSDRLQAFGGNGLAVSSEALLHALRLVTGADYPLARGAAAPEPAPGFWSTVETGSTLVAILLTALVLVGGARGLMAFARRSSERDAGLILLVWFGLPVLAMSVVSQVVHPFYLLLTLPAGAGLAGWGADWAIHRVTTPGARRALLTGAVIVAVGIAAIETASALRYSLETAALPGAHGLGALPLQDGLALGEQIRAARPAGGTVLADVDEWTLASFTGQTFPFIRDARAPVVTILPAGGGVYVSAAAPDEAVPVLPISGGQNPLSLADGVVLTVDALPASPALPPDSTPLEAIGDRGIDLVGYALRQLDGNEYALQTIWRVTDPALAAGNLFAPFAHLFDASGQRVAVADGQAVPPFEWRAGDLHVQEIRFQVEAPVTLAVGQYDGAAGVNVVFRLPDGTFSPLIPLPAAESD